MGSDRRVHNKFVCTAYEGTMYVGKLHRIKRKLGSLKGINMKKQENVVGTLLVLLEFAEPQK